MTNSAKIYQTNKVSNSVSTVLLAANAQVLSAATWTNITDGTTAMSASITPTASSSKILILSSLAIPGTGAIAYRYTRGGSPICVATSVSSRTACTFSGATTITGVSIDGCIMYGYLDSPSTTSSTTYVVQAYSNGGATLYINRSNTDTDTSSFQRGISSLILIEIPA